ncbi:PREDICTED: uncharacterized protein LOC109244106 [Nicotiana attenuata]|uniref:uncharacterized protein LOC109244106 n=1 Tax=Nicotiana attenuata TaxID=49451 RepID=UPI00090598F4|nr:PREDICTED: uncharacterized protein LOC109244106 [Nicotiana attenuata]
MSRFVRVRTSDLIPAEWMSFHEEWNMKPTPLFPGGVPDLEGWVRKLASTSSYSERLGDVVAMRPAPAGEEETAKPSKEKKRKRESPANPSMPKISAARKSKADTVALSPEMAQRLRDQEEEEDDNCLLVDRKRGNVGALKSVEPVMVDVVHSKAGEISEGGSNKVPEPSGRKKVVVLHKRAFSKSRSDLARCEAEFKKIKEEMDSLKTLYVKKEEEISDLRAELAKAFSAKGRTGGAASRGAQDEGGRNPGLEARHGQSCFRERKPSGAAGFTRTETLEEVHARGFDLSADIEKAKALEEEVAALLSDEHDSASGSESGGDEDGVPEGEDPEDTAPEDAAAEDMAPK